MYEFIVVDFIRRDSSLNALEFLPKVSSAPANKIKSEKRQNNEITDIKGRANLRIVINKNHNNNNKDDNEILARSSSLFSIRY